MNKNYEIKCEIENAKDLDRIKSCLSVYKSSLEKQIDIYYKVSSGRLKLRIINNTAGSLILYNRNEAKKKRVSNYLISMTNDFKELDCILRKQFKILVIVEKSRSIFIKRNIRVHIDKVKDLGVFLEIEIIYDNFLKASKQMQTLISELGLDESKFIKVSYSDLLINKK